MTIPARLIDFSASPLGAMPFGASNVQVPMLAPNGSPAYFTMQSAAPGTPQTAPSTTDAGTASASAHPPATYSNSTAAAYLTSANILGPGAVEAYAIHAKAILQIEPAARGWTFGILQFIRTAWLDATYRGAVRNEGEIFAQYYDASERTSLWLDRSVRADRTAPWYDPLTRNEITAASPPRVCMLYGDRPEQSIPLRRLNMSTNIENYLTHVFFRYEFTTVLAAQDPARRSLQPISSFDWMVDWNFNFNRLPGDRWTAAISTCRGKVVDPPSTQNLRRRANIERLFAASPCRMPQALEERRAPTIVNPYPTWQ
jgi:hypothetical protein